MNILKTHPYYSSLDFTKLIATVLVIAIHTRPLELLSEPANFYLCNVLARTAVPLFFAISGFLFFNKIKFKNGRIAKDKDNLHTLFRYLKRIGILYIAWSAIYLIHQLPEWYAIGWWGLPMIKSYIVTFFLRYSHWHLWYLVALIYGLIISYCILRFAGKRFVIWFCTILSISECLLHSDSWLGIGQIAIIEKLLSVFESPCYALFRATPLILIGATCTLISSRKSKNFWLFGSALCLGLWFVEATLLRLFTSNAGEYIFLLMTPIFTWFAMNFLLACQFKLFNRSVGVFIHKVCENVYCLHPMVIYIYKALGLPEGISKFLVVTLVSFVVSLIFITIYGRVRLSRINCHNIH